jgi:opacity protein-like surface antigen
MKKQLLGSLAVFLASTSLVFSQEVVVPDSTGTYAATASSDSCAGAGRGVYAGFFGGGGVSNTINATQNGTALFTLGGPPDGLGPLPVIANGTVRAANTWIGGVHVGREWSSAQSGDGWGLMPAAEFEAFYLGTTLNGNVTNPTPRLPEHTFQVAFPINAGVFLADAVLSLRTPIRNIYPYVGAGVGSALVTIDNANSAQVAPLERNVNHFNSGPNSSCWSFAAQAKMGVRYALTERWSLFAEYRFLYLGSTEYTFGPTQYPTHAPTTPWNVHVGGICDHLAVGGIEFRF